MRLSSAFTQKGTDKNVEEVVILKAGIICVRSSDSRVFPYAKSLHCYLKILILND